MNFGTLNFTIFNLICANIISFSPAFVNNQVAVSKSYFNRISFLIFYNQQNLYINNSYFKKSLDSIISADYIEDFNDHISYHDSSYDNYIQFPEKQKSISILGCVFIDINLINLSKSVINIDGPQHSLYITDTTFTNCTTDNGTIFITTGRCVTITHSCCSDCIGLTGGAFLYYKCQDYLVFLYSTLIFHDNYTKSIYSANSNFISGDQTYKCINATNTPFTGFQFDSPHYFYFKMITLMNTNHVVYANRIKIYGDKDAIAPERDFEMVNLYSYVTGIYRPYTIRILASGTFVFTRCVFIDGFSGYIFDLDSSCTINIICRNCLYRETNTITGTTIDCASVPNTVMTKYLTSYPYYTNQYCEGVGMGNKAVEYGCKNDECLDEKNDCFYDFPSGVIPYTTIHHDEFQTRQFTESPVFSHSIEFTQTNLFSKSEGFSVSKSFSRSSLFTDSIKFSFSFMFSKSKEFSKSRAFSNSIQFSHSDLFSISAKFSQSNLFSLSNSFQDSEKFSGSNFFSFSEEFTKSEKFTSTNKFSKSDLFTHSDIFLPSKLFSKSNYFSDSNFFSVSNKFTQSILFSKSDKFSGSNQFSNSPFISSNQFSHTHFFSFSNVFSQSLMFTETSFFSKSNLFSDSTLFSQSKNDLRSDLFLNSDAEFFSVSKMFSIVHIFSSTSSFTESKLLVVSSPDQKVTFSISYILTYVARRSVSFSLSYSLSNSVIYTFVNGNYTYSRISSEFLYYFPYIITIFPTSYQITYIPSIIHPRRGITAEQLIALSCGLAAAFFFFLAIVILLIQKRNKEKSKLYYEFYSSSDNNEINHAQNENLISKETNQRFSDQSLSDDLDFWL